ncbi:Ger(x)C family spore germination protein [Paenisporosarcina indica]|uniref:Ger(x)C family spore germination protein n=1 Tax=Paenisporosarcina indica TaxID=650093 RepID=UPI00094F9929|nr:Ger(x)C family spore germination protein [Paenisporosarcina indica]
MKRCTFVLLILCLLLTGCWDRRELNEISITLAMAIDKVEDEYQLTVQVVVPSEVSMKTGTGRSTVTLFQAKGETVYEALRKMTVDSPRKIYPGHLQMLVLGEELAREGISESLELLSRDWEIRSDFFVAVARGVTAAEILNVSTTLENIPANKMFNTLKTSEGAWSATNGISLNELITDLVSDGKEAVLTGIFITGDQEIGSSKQNAESITPAARIQYDHLAIFKKDKLVGWLTESESRGYNGITDSVKTTVGPISCPNGGKATIEVIKFKTNVKGKINNGNPEVDIEIKVNGNVGEVQCHIDLTKQESIDELAKIYEDELRKNINQTIETAQKKYKTDIFGFGNAIHRSNPREWKKIKDQWDEKFSDLNVNIKIDVKLQRMGTLDNSFLEKMKD